MPDASGHLEPFATRARNRPLNLVIDTWSSEHLATSGRNRPLDIVLPLRHKLQHIELTLNWDECQSFGLPVNNTFPVLSSLSIDIYNSSRLPQPEFIHLIDSFGTLPALQSLMLHAVERSGDPLLSMVPWSQLTSLDLCVAVKAVTAQHILLQAERLRTLVVLGIDFSDNVPTILPIRILPAMHTIKYSTDSANTTAAFFQPFSFPNLKSFNLDARDESQDVLLDLHAQSGFRLEELELYGLGLATDELIFFLRLQPSLIYLSLHYYECVDDNLFTSFTYDPFLQPQPFRFRCSK
jgi:hypothetical protein